MATTTTTTSVRFNWANPADGQMIFFQPLFYLTKMFNKKTDQFLEMAALDSTFVDKINLSFVLDRFQKDPVTFTIPLEEGSVNLILTIQMDDRPIFNKLLRGNGNDYVTSCYTISFLTQQYPLFEEFIRKAVASYNDYFASLKRQQNKLKIFLSSDDGSYFESLGYKNKRNLTTIFLPHETKQSIVADLKRFLNPATKARYLELGIPYKRIYLFHGPPGTGKTSLISALASEFGYNLAMLYFTPKMTDVGLARTFRSLNRECGEERNVFIVLEDIDCMFFERKSHDAAKNSVTMSGVLNALDGATSADDTVCFITSNELKHIDPAIIRPGRVDYIVKIDHLLKEQVKEMYIHFIGEPTMPAQFFDDLTDLQIDLAPRLLQQYLFKYEYDPAGALKNLSELKEMYVASHVNESKTKQGDAWYS